MSAWSEELDTLYKTQELCEQHALNDVVPDLIAENFVSLQRVLLPKLRSVFVENAATQPTFQALSTQFPTNPVYTSTWGEMGKAIGNLILAMHLALPYVDSPLFEERLRDSVYPAHEMITVAVGKDLLSSIQSPDLPIRIQQLREKMEDIFGFSFPKIKFTDNQTLDPQHYSISIAGEIRSGIALKNKLLAISTKGEFPSLQGIECTDPIFGLPAKWISSMFERTAKQQDCVVLSPLAVIISHIERLLRLQYHTLLTSEVLTALIKTHKDVASVYIALPKQDWLELFKHCLRTQIPLTELPRMIDSVLAAQKTVDPEVAQNADYLYVVLRSKFSPIPLKGRLERGKLPCIELSEDMQNQLIAEVDVSEGRIRMPHFQRLLQQVKEAVLSVRDQNPTLILPDVLVPDMTRRLTRQGFALLVMMESEIPDHVQREQVVAPLEWPESKAMPQ